MARRLPSWHWIRTVRARGPESPSVRAVLFALAVRMSDDGEAFPSQKTIAADTALSERTVREALLEARRRSWLGVIDRVRPGHAWRLSHYVACVPDGLNLASVDLGGDIDLERMADVWAAQLGDVADRMHGLPRRGRGGGRRAPKGAATIAARRSWEKGEGAATIAARRSWEKGEGAANERQNVRQPSPEGAANERQNVRQPSPTKFPYKYPYKYQKKGHALAHVPEGVKDANGRNQNHGTAPEPSASIPAAIGAERPRLKEVWRGGERPTPKAPSPEQISKLIRTLPHLSDHEVAKILHGDPLEVRSVRHGLQGVA